MSSKPNLQLNERTVIFSDDTKEVRHRVRLTQYDNDDWFMSLHEEYDNDFDLITEEDLEFINKCFKEARRL